MIAYPDHRTPNTRVDLYNERRILHVDVVRREVVSKDLCAVAVLVLAIAAFGTSSARADSPCEADWEKYCPRSEYPDPSLKHAECMQAHESEYSPQCQRYLADQSKEIKQKVEVEFAKCDGEFQALCNHGPDFYKCLRTHQDQVSQTCKNLCRQVGSCDGTAKY